MADVVDTWNLKALEDNINAYKMFPSLVKVETKNLMFEANADFLRPELAQGIFVNFNAYKTFLNSTKDFAPFGICQLGKSFRKEISPQQFLRMREFSQFELEYFVDPEAKTHPRYNAMKSVIIPLLSASMQTSGQSAIMLSVQDALDQNVISHQLMGYFLSVIYQFGLMIGLKADKMRFRQHMSHEMAHYAIQCWDLECLVNNDWLECVGCADRGCYDLTVHSAHPNEKLVGSRKLAEPQVIVELKVKPVYRSMPDAYKSELASIGKYFDELSVHETQKVIDCLTRDNKYELDRLGVHYVFDNSLLTIQSKKTTITHEDFYPHVLEPSFGIDRLMYAVLEQNFSSRVEDPKRLVLSLPPVIAPYVVSVFYLYDREDMVAEWDQVRSILDSKKIRYYVDTSSISIGKKYVRSDEMGIPFAVTVDTESKNDQCVTIRNRDDMTQIRISVSYLGSHLVQWI
jgi:glycyl-tRNA synthetase